MTSKETKTSHAVFLMSDSCHKKYGKGLVTGKN